ncbi:hypothetical protein [Nocardioides sp. LHG3406-4]|uniref:hypothetical protein n=1 Tax=Nocardioides sp. LHG3406-4 TaxID=2804575 RepID=UPI003CF467A2
MTKPTVMQLLRNRDLTVPAEHETALEDYWTKLRGLRAQVDESLLADHEIAVTWSAAEEQA